MAILEVMEFPNVDVKRQCVKVHGVSAVDGKVKADGSCGDGSYQFAQIEIWGSEGATLRVVMRCDDKVVFDEEHQIPAGADYYDSGYREFYL